MLKTPKITEKQQNSPKKTEKNLILRIFQCIFRSVNPKGYSGKMGECPDTATADGHSHERASRNPLGYSMR